MKLDTGFYPLNAANSSYHSLKPLFQEKH